MVNEKKVLTEREIAVLLLCTGAMQFGPKPLKYHDTHPDAPENWVSANIRGEPKGVLSAGYLHAIGRHMAEWTSYHRLKADDAKYIVGLPMAGEPLAEGFIQVWRDWSDKCPELIRLQKEEGEGFRHIAPVDSGGLESGAKVWMVDDVITAAGTKIEAIDALRQMGLEPIGCSILLDREQGGRAQVEACGVKVGSSFTLTWLLDFYQEMRLISDEVRSRVDESLVTMAAYMADHP